jgi:hypothetical protein
MAKKARKRPVKASASPMPAIAPRAWKVPAAIVLLCGALYGWTLPFPMVFDDDTYLLNNPFFRAESFGYPFRFHEFVNAPQQMGLDPDLAVNFVTRPVSYATFYVNHLLGGWNTWGFRLVNVLLHTANSLLLWALLRLLMSRLTKAGKISQASTAFIPAAAALLFAAHPLAVESVTYIVQRFTSLAAFWSLLAAWLYFRSTEDGLEKARVIRFRASSAVVMLLGMLTKECAVVTPLLIVLLDVLVTGTAWKITLRRAWPLLACLPVIPMLVLMSSASLNGGSLDLSAGLNIVNSRDEPVTHLQYLLTQITVIAHYLRLMLWPSGQNIDPAWDTHSTLLSWPVAGALLLHLGLITLATFGYRVMREVDFRTRLVLAGVLCRTWWPSTAAICPRRVSSLCSPAFSMRCVEPSCSAHDSCMPLLAAFYSLSRRRRRFEISSGAALRRSGLMPRRKAPANTACGAIWVWHLRSRGVKRTLPSAFASPSISSLLSPMVC